MNKQTFDFLLNELGPYIVTVPTQFREPVPVDERLAHALLLLGNGATVRHVALTFRRRHTTVQDSLYFVVRALLRHLVPKYIQWPKG